MPVVMDAERISRALTRISHEILEHNRGLADLALVGVRSRGVPIAQRIADERHTVQADAEAAPDFFQQAGFGLAAVAAGVLGVRAIENTVDTPAGQSQRAVHLVVDRVQRRHVEQAAADARLVGGHQHAVTGLVEQRNRFQAAGDRFPFRGALDVRRAVVIDDAVAVEDDEFHRTVMSDE